MIPFIRSLDELMIITQSRDWLNKSNQSKESNNFLGEYGPRKKHINPMNRKNLELPDLPKTQRLKWVKRKEAVSKFFNELDYNNQIQSSYDLTLLESQNNYNHHDVA